MLASVQTRTNTSLFERERERQREYLFQRKILSNFVVIYSTEFREVRFVVRSRVNRRKKVCKFATSAMVDVFSRPLDSIGSTEWAAVSWCGQLASGCARNWISSFSMETWAGWPPLTPRLPLHLDNSTWKHTVGRGPFVRWTPGSFIPAGLELIYHYTTRGRVLATGLWPPE